MFTGLIEEVGTVVDVRPNETAKRLEIAAPQLSGKIQIGDSVAVNGCCLTISSVPENALCFDLLNETLERTNLKNIAEGSRVNLERALSATARLGGHFVQGH